MYVRDDDDGAFSPSILSFLADSYFGDIKVSRPESEMVRNFMLAGDRYVTP